MLTESIIISNFDEGLTCGRWRLINYKNVHSISSELGSQGSENSSISVTSNEVHYSKPETQHHKFKATLVIVLRMATVISEAGTKEFNMKMAQTKELLQYWENGTSAEVVRKECTSNDEEVSGDSEIIDDLMRDDDDHMSDDHFDNDNNVDVSRMAIETQDVLN